VAYVAGRSAGAARWPTRHDASGSSLIGMDETVVRTDRLTKRYGQRLAVDSVSLTVGRGEGPSVPRHAWIPRSNRSLQASCSAQKTAARQRPSDSRHLVFVVNVPGCRRTGALDLLLSGGSAHRSPHREMDWRRGRSISALRR
jgi:hypothetical protein